MQIFSNVIGRKRNSDEFWQTLKLRLEKKFRGGLSQEEEEQDPLALKSKLDMAVLFRRLEELLGIRLTEQARAELEAYPESFEFVQSDVAEIYPKVRHMNIVEYAGKLARFFF